MIKLHASYGRKMPGDSQYSSCHASASIDFEISEHDVNQIPTRLSGAWGLLREAVEKELARQQTNQYQHNRLTGNPHDHVQPNGHDNGFTNSPHPSNTNPANGNGFGGNGNGHHGPGVHSTPHPGVPSNGAPRNGNGYHNGNGHANNGHGAPSFGPQAQVAAPNAVATPPADPRATKKQIGFLLATARRNHNWTAEQVKAWVSQQFGCALNDLTKQQAGQLIDSLQGR